MSDDAKRKTSGKRLAVFIIVGVLVALWLSGSMDQPLSKVGLNRNPCVQNSFGATFCGEAAKRVCHQFGGDGCRDAGLSTSGSLEDTAKDAGY